MGMKHGRAGYHIYRSQRWQAIRMQAKRRDGFRCTECGARGRLEVHHKRSVRQAPELAYDLGNVTCLCPTCHHKQTMAERGICPKPAREAWQTLLSERNIQHAGICENPAQAKRNSPSPR